MKKQLIRMVWVLLALLGLLSVGACAYIQHPKFGRLPEGERLDIIQKSPNYADGEFRNQVPTPMFTDGSSFLDALVSNLFTKSVRPKPGVPLPSIKTDLKALDPAKDTVVWMGHSSYFVQLGGKRLLIDPVFSTSAAPVTFANKAFEGTSIYTAEDMPAIDYLLITHDHWDHLDYPSVKALEPKVRHVVAGLGVGAYLEQWGYSKEKIHEADWFATVNLEEGFTIHVLPARHYSGRLLTRNRTLWAGYALETSTRRIFFSGDSGYGPHFREIGQRYKGFDLAVLDTGQYDRRWANIHMNPEEAARAADELQAKTLLPAHVGRFTLAKHSWDEPFKRISAASEGKRPKLLTPKIGEPLYLDGHTQQFSKWWEGID
ncbi:MBL fold metallo-hydrolase [Noviherbaspirillum sedimenti]|uniref:MBL fold metallo-hydrolase n=1 Tax=Noviherbaspirillum sedimenti TaxID=2320865 RepID=A0A3A3FYT0_9BURK|nr:MBL fold metallo-hydrolase [Noviherbaspirillum sedimenti]RJG01297.1 MBL fold metallo-hydrolase [Noviherbaspirillum sedimenti]